MKRARFKIGESSFILFSKCFPAGYFEQLALINVYSFAY